MNQHYGNGCCGHQTPGIDCPTDYGPQPAIVNIACATLQNPTFRTAFWTGTYLQLTLMCIPVCGKIDPECHRDTDQFLRLEQGQGIVKMGCSKDNLCFQKCISKDDAIFVPAGTWHNITNTGRCPIKLYSIYAPAHHPWGTVHPTKADAAHD